MDQGEYSFQIVGSRTLLTDPQSEMYRPNDVLMNGHRISNIFNTQDEQWHNKYLRPIRNLWSINKVLEYEPLIDETLNKFVEKLGTKFADGKTVCPADEWLSFCKFAYSRCSARY